MIKAVWIIGWGLLDTFLKYRFLEKMLGAKYRYAYLWFYLGSFIYGQMNVRFSLAGTVRGNFIYLFGCSFVLDLLLFHGSMIKKAFFTLWMYCAPGLAADGLIIIAHALAAAEGQSRSSDIVLEIISITACLVQYLMMEILQRRLYILKRDFANQDILYLMSIILFIYAAVSMITSLFDGISGWTEEALPVTAALCSMTAFCGAGLHVYCIVKLEANLLKQLAVQQYESLNQYMETAKEQYEQMMKIRHDIKNHGLCVGQLLSDGRVREVQEYLEQLNLRMEQGRPAVQTGSVFVDALLNPKYQQARRFGIDIDISMTVPGEEQAAPLDICCLLANALDNAIEACRRGNGEDAGWIRMKAGMHPGYWVLEVRNSIFSPIAVQDGKILSSKRVQSCGAGLRNIKEVVERYEGVLDIQSDPCFVLSVMLPMPSASEKKPSAS